MKTDIVRKTECNAKIKNIEDKTTLNAKIYELKREIPNITNLATTAALNAKANEVKGKIPNKNKLGTTTVENTIPIVSNLVKKTDYNTKVNVTEKKIKDHDHDKYITAPECNTFTAGNFAARLTQANLASKSDIVNFVKKSDFDDQLKNVTLISTKGLTKDLINKFSILNRAKYLSSGIFQNCLYQKKILKI